MKTAEEVLALVEGSRAALVDGETLLGLGITNEDIPSVEEAFDILSREAGTRKVFTQPGRAHYRESAVFFGTAFRLLASRMADLEVAARSGTDLEIETLRRDLLASFQDLVRSMEFAFAD